MVGLLVLLPWDLNKLRLEITCPFLHLLQVLLHPFALALVVAVYLTCDYLRVVIHDHIRGYCYFGKI